MTTTWGVGVGDGDTVGEELGDAGATDDRAGVAACAVPHAARVKARAGAIIRVRMVARGFYERGPTESIADVLTFPGR